MGNGIRKQCAGFAKSGDRCGRKALKGSRFCGLKSHQAQGNEGDDVSVVKPPTNHARPGAETLFSPDFQSLIDLCRNEIKTPTKGSMQKLQWARLLLDAVRHAKDELRELEAQHVVYHIVNEDPLGPADEAPPLPALPAVDEAAG